MAILTSLRNIYFLQVSTVCVIHKPLIKKGLMNYVTRKNYIITIVLFISALFCTKVRLCNAN